MGALDEPLLDQITGKDVDLLLSKLSDDALRRLAGRLKPYLELEDADDWMDARRAAEHLGISRDSLHQITASRRIEFAQAKPNAKLWFKREWLDDYRMRTWPLRPPTGPSREGMLR